jgi:hypothetical protein
LHVCARGGKGVVGAINGQTPEVAGGTAYGIGETLDGFIPLQL